MTQTQAKPPDAIDKLDGLDYGDGVLVGRAEPPSELSSHVKFPPIQQVVRAGQPPSELTKPCPDCGRAMKSVGLYGRFACQYCNTYWEPRDAKTGEPPSESDYQPMPPKRSYTVQATVGEVRKGKPVPDDEPPSEPSGEEMDACKREQARRLYARYVKASAEADQLRSEVERLNKEVQRWQKLSEMHADSESKWKDEAIARAEAAEKEVERLHREGCIPREADEAGTRLGYDETEKWKKYAWAKSCEAEGRGKLVGELNAELESCQADCAVITAALDTLMKRMDEVHADSAYQGVWQYAHVHGYRYQGPTYMDELAVAKQALQRPAGAALLEELRAAREALQAILRLSPDGQHYAKHARRYAEEALAALKVMKQAPH